MSEEGFERFCRDVTVKENAGKLTDDFQDLRWASQMLLQDLNDEIFKGKSTKNMHRVEQYQKDFREDFKNTCKKARDENDFANRCDDPSLQAELYKDLSIMCLSYGELKMQEKDKTSGKQLLDLSRQCRREAERCNPDLYVKDLDRKEFATRVIYSSPGDIFLFDATPDAKTRSWQLMICK